MTEQEKRLTVRLPKSLFDKIQELAKQERRSVNSQIIYLLEQATKAVENGD